MKTKLDKELSGIRRPIALLLTDDASVESKLEDYAISQLEPVGSWHSKCADVLVICSSHNSIL